MKSRQVDWQQPWYHGSNQAFTRLKAGSTITQWRELAEAFSHQPKNLWINDDESLGHNGPEDGYLYQIDELLNPEDLEPVPGSTMAPGLEWLTRREIPLRLLSRSPGVKRACNLPPTPAEFERAHAIVAEVFQETEAGRSLSAADLQTWTQKILQTCFALCLNYGEEPVRAIAMARVREWKRAE